MSWASKRETTRIEDMAYCLLGIFDVNLSLIYGERRKAFSRLQEAVLQATGDLSILAWMDERPDCPEFTGFLAESPRQFARCSGIKTTASDPPQELKVTALEIDLQAGLMQLRKDGVGHQVVLDIASTSEENSLGIYMRKMGGSRFVRWKPSTLARFRPPPTKLTSIRKAVRWDARDLFDTTDSVIYDGTRDSVRKKTLFSRSPDMDGPGAARLVQDSRHTVLRMTLRCQPHIKVELHQSSPESHWDPYEQAFSCARGTGRCWSAWFNSIQIQIPGEGLKRFAFFISCFFWSSEEPVIVFAPFHETYGQHGEYQLQFALARIMFENWGEADRTISSAFRGHMLTLEEQMVFDVERRNELVVSFEKTREMVPSLCANPVLTICLNAEMRTKRR
ncbi:hypothetical protein B0T16DRAFT_414172 [Cercophora newfieldiana]|uniref:Uncharacterized protein n=1 Tax=Cercophora newfieldiana TaxID=92897 RepID=A0AA40CPW6_9PEZI|nr:hypothetical protein B0T16DRAFT_414172 [Cercophora newfieldiana]